MSVQPEFYPMPSFPFLAVADLAKSSRWYQDVLGFAHVFTMPGPGSNPALVHLRWLKYADLLLRAGPSAEGLKGVGITLNFAMMDRSLDALAARAREFGAHFIQEPGDRP
jgi:catechol 2,3-dioxygenase-like lactoylglutathione lyase family enzyme